MHHVIVKLLEKALGPEKFAMVTLVVTLVVGIGLICKFLEWWLHKGDVQLKANGKPAPGETLTISGTLAKRLKGAKVQMVLVGCPLSKPQDGLSEWKLNMPLTTAEITAKDELFEWKVYLPAKLPYTRLEVRAYAKTEHHNGHGVLELDTVPPF
jgi:hypothetical protein